MPRHFHNQRSSRPRREDDDEDELEPIASTPDDLVKPAGIEPFGASPPFGFLCSLYEKFEAATRNKHKPPKYKAELLKEFFHHWRQNVGPDLFPLVRLLIPERDTRRRTYNLKEAKIAKALIYALDIPPANSAATKLINWKTPTKDDPGAGEFATVAYEVIKTRSTVLASSSEVTIDGINDLLDKLSHTAGRKTAPGELQVGLATVHGRLLKKCFETMTASEMKWLIRIVLRDLKIGMGEKTIFNQLHDDAMEVFNTCSDIKRVCWRLYNPHERVVREDSSVSLGSIFRPMLAWRSKQLSDIIKAMRKNRPRRGPEYEWNEGEYKDDEFIIEEKLDGERIQLHKMGNKYLYASRKAKDYTYLYGASANEGSLTPFIQDALIDGIEEVILDGEMLVWDPNMSKYMPFGNLKTFAIANKEHIGPTDSRPCFKVFDILYVRGDKGPMNLLKTPLWNRKRILEQILKPKKGIIEIADCAKGKTTEDMRAYLERILEERGEGLVIKHPQSLYTLGSREEAWVKLKPEYMDSLGEHIDAVVIGGYWGQGGRAGYLASYLIGLRGKLNDKDVVHSFAKVGTGFNAASYEWIFTKHGHKFYPADKSNPPEWFHTVSEWPDVFINPRESFVLDVKAAEIVGGAEYGAGMTLRFPRCSRTVVEKEWDDTLDVTDLRILQSGPKKRQTDGELSTSRKSVRTNTSKKAVSVAVDIGDVPVNSQIFEGIMFYVHSLKTGVKNDLETKIKGNEGEFMQTIPPAETYEDRIIVAPEFTGVKNKRGWKEVDIVKPAWIDESIERGRRMPLLERLLHHASPTTVAVKDEPKDELSFTPSVSPPPFTRTSASPPSATAFREPAPNYGEAAADSEDEPETEAEEEEDWYFVKKEESDSDEAHTEVREGVKGIVLDPAAVEVVESQSQAEVRQRVQGLGVDSATDESQPTLASTSQSQHSQSTVKQDGESDESQTVAGADAFEMIDEDEAEDPMKPFKRFYAYFDTNANALHNNLPSSTASEAVQKRADKKLLSAQAAFIAGGGIATDNLLHPKLTHLVATKLVNSRYIELIRRTTQPAYRRPVTEDWIGDSVEEGTAVDEDDYKF